MLEHLVKRLILLLPSIDLKSYKFFRAQHCKILSQYMNDPTYLLRTHRGLGRNNLHEYKNHMCSIRKLKLVKRFL